MVYFNHRQATFVSMPASGQGPQCAYRRPQALWACRHTVTWSVLTSLLLTSMHAILLLTSMHATALAGLQAYPSGVLIQPLALCTFDGNFAPALHRMLGGTLIAMTNEVAADAASQCDSV